MSELTLTRTRFFEGTWEGVVQDRAPGAGDPAIQVLLKDRPVEGVELRRDAAPGSWTLRFPVPARLLSEGSHTFVFADASDGGVLDSFSIIAGEALGDDIRAEVDMLRAELDMLKRAFRRHCRETG
ncbi:MAG: hypothetical protein RID15_05960 [Marinovum algicola]|jgi:hypothetical protein|uniref:Uncharacterized protein n=1 Tax=Marinovum algicola TaxID=42444 RepID=A0A975W932_9RHOB|nr:MULTISPECIES: hypothetical protein [Marinovum]AKO98402.1 hypothetical protein MALG_03258 [Marinovum algicola DG 898]MDD9740491.1 hypothetical protein [Marinovum sp. SP66]MDD9746517.1 hypothetical protein [Marinovum sp. PR37]SEJ24995.1 hypothetical protein SAMN04487940_104183 [Marinovum algicola]SLN47636.1 hypothetical protein MAA5396_02374 [Marinovum algicola]